MTLTVIIPVWNQEMLILRALESVPYGCEIIVIDDCSTDNTLKSVKAYIKDNPTKNIKLLRNEINRGVGYTVNKGLDAATGDYILLLGSDDYLLPEITKVMEYSDKDMIYFDLRINDGSIFRLTPRTKEQYCGSTKLIRREFIGDTRNPEIRSAEDYIFYQELLKKNPTEKFTGVVAKHYNFPREGSLYQTKGVNHEEV